MGAVDAGLQGWSRILREPASVRPWHFNGDRFGSF